MFSLFIHWGLYSIPAGIWEGERIGGYSEQIMAHARISKAEYEALAGQFDPKLWDPFAVVRLAKDAGMDSIVITAKHHDGFCLFHSRFTDFNVVDATPYGRDIIGELARACADGGINFGIYFSTIDWHYEGANGIDYDPDGSVRNDNLIPDEHARFNVGQLTELLTSYGPIEQVWFDMGRPTPEQSRMFADTVHRLQPSARVSGRVFNRCGDFAVMGDNEAPEDSIDGEWQSPASIFDETWGYRSWQHRENLEDKIAEHVKRLTKVLSRGGSYLLNIGPRGDGSIVDYEAEVIRGLGVWRAEQSREIAPAPTQAVVAADASGTFSFSERNGERFLTYNNRGYYDRPALTRLKWGVFLSEAGAYTLNSKFEGKIPKSVKISIADQSLSQGESSNIEWKPIKLPPGPCKVEMIMQPEGEFVSLTLEPLRD